MDKLRLRAAGKINLFLEILGVRPDGYHDLSMVLQSVDLADTVILQPARTIALHCAHPLVPTDRTNLAWRAAELVQARTGIADGVEILIEKRIPVASGMAGGSTNAAAVLVGLNVLWKLGLTARELQRLAAELGSDIPFCIEGGTALGLGRGDELTPLMLPNTLHLVVAKPVDLQVSTAWAYRTYREQHLAHRPPNRTHSKEMLAAIGQGDVEAIAAHLFNDLEAAVLPACPEVVRLRDRLRDAGALAAMMSGSGPSVFGLAADEANARSLYDALAGDPEVEVHLCRTVAGGIEVETTA